MICSDGPDEYKLKRSELVNYVLMTISYYKLTCSGLVSICSGSCTPLNFPALCKIFSASSALLFTTNQGMDSGRILETGRHGTAGRQLGVSDS